MLVLEAFQSYMQHVVLFNDTSQAWQVRQVERLHRRRHWRLARTKQNDHIPPWRKREKVVLSNRISFHLHNKKLIIERVKRHQNKYYITLTIKRIERPDQMTYLDYESLAKR